MVIHFSSTIRVVDSLLVNVELLVVGLRETVMQFNLGQAPGLTPSTASLPEQSIRLLQTSNGLFVCNVVRRVVSTGPKRDFES